MEVATLRTIFLVLIVLAAIWIVRVVAKREWENVLRTALFLILVLAGFYYVAQSKEEKITWSVLKEDFKRTFFPEKPLNYPYTKQEGIQGSQRYVRYYFGEIGPKISLTLDPTHQYFHIKDIHSVNRVLEYLGLEKVKTPVPELASLTGSRNDLNYYRWDDYPRGILIIERGICQDRDRLESFQCIVSVTVLTR
ncbi:MAG: hypothetical protein ACUVV5_00570 [Candidatus Aminicenantales bacterium]